MEFKLLDLTGHRATPYLGASRTVNGIKSGGPDFIQRNPLSPLGSDIEIDIEPQITRLQPLSSYVHIA